MPEDQDDKTWCFDVAEFGGWVDAFVVPKQYWKKEKMLDPTVTLSDIQEDHPEFNFAEAAEAQFEIGHLDDTSIQEAEEKLKGMGMEKIDMEHI